jgi:hypothetical protein
MACQLARLWWAHWPMACQLARLRGAHGLPACEALVGQLARPFGPMACQLARLRGAHGLPAGQAFWGPWHASWPGFGGPMACQLARLRGALGLPACQALVGQLARPFGPSLLAGHAFWGPWPASWPGLEGPMACQLARLRGAVQTIRCTGDRAIATCLRSVVARQIVPPGNTLPHQDDWRPSVVARNGQHCLAVERHAWPAGFGGPTG